MKQHTHAGWLILTAAVGLSATASAQEEPLTEETTWTSESSWDIPGEYIVDFEDDVAEASIREVMGNLGIRFREGPLEDDTRMEIATIPAAAEALLARLADDPRVEGVEPLAKVRAFGFKPNDPMYAKQWHMTRIGAEEAWGISIGRGVTVAVVDTGIACENFDAFTKASDLLQTRCVDGYNFINNSGHANDDHGHGTHVAGTIAQSTNNTVGVTGLAFGARLMPVKVLSANGWGTTAGVAAGIRWAADNGAQVINLSLGGPRNSGVLQRAVDHAVKKGAVVIAAAGNSGGSVGFPGGCEGAVGVSATDDKDGLAWFSSRGKGVDIAAPGVSVTQQTICERGRNRCEIYPAYNGTSMASPHVAGVAALLASLGVTNPAAVEAALTASAKSLDDSEAGRGKFGAGLLQAGAALEAVWLKQTLWRLGALLLLSLVAFRFASRKGKGKIHSPASPGYWLAALVAGVGALFFAPWVMSRHDLWADMLSRPLVEWDTFVSAGLHAWLPLANAGLPLLLIALFMRVKGAAPWLAGFAVGTGAYLAAVAGLGQLATPFGTLLTTVWCAVNAAVCVYLASLVLVKDA